MSSSPANDNYYCNFDVINDESSTNVAEIELSIEMPRTIEEVMKDVIVYVEVRSGTGMLSLKIYYPFDRSTKKIIKRN